MPVMVDVSSTSMVYGEIALPGKQERPVSKNWIIANTKRKNEKVSKVISVMSASLERTIHQCKKYYY